MKNFTTFSLNNPLGIQITGTGEYVKKQCANLVNIFEEAKSDALEEIRQEQENG